MPDRLERLIAAGDVDGLEEFASEDEDAIAVDWRETEDDIVEDIAGRLKNDMLSYERSDDANGDLRLLFNGRSELVGLTHTPVDRCIALFALNRVMKDRYEIRAFSSSVGAGDTLTCCLRSAGWWARMQENYPEQTAAAFTVFRQGIDLFAVSGAEEAAVAPQREWKVAAKASVEAQKKPRASPSGATGSTGPIRPYLPASRTSASPSGEFTVVAKALGFLILFIFVVSVCALAATKHHVFALGIMLAALMGLLIPWNRFRK